jgi:hypothetical protein
MAVDKAADYRRRAQELRTLIATMRNADTAAILRHLADQHDAMAARLEAQAAAARTPGPK